MLHVSHGDFDLEVIVVDDGSTDETPAVASSYPGVRYLRASGGAAVRNVGLEAARGEFIAFLDDDDIYLPTNIAPQLALLREHPEYGLVYAQVQLTNTNRIPYGEPVPAGPLCSGWIFDDLLTHWPQIGTVVVRAEVQREIGGFDPALVGDEEWDWLLRTARRYQIGRIEQPVVLYRTRSHGFEELMWRRMPDTLRVFRRHTREGDWALRLKRERILWAHRGWYAASFLDDARWYARAGDRARALRCLQYAVRASPLHTAASVARSLCSGAAGGGRRVASIASGYLDRRRRTQLTGAASGRRLSVCLSSDDASLATRTHDGLEAAERRYYGHSGGFRLTPPHAAGVAGNLARESDCGWVYRPARVRAS